VFVEMRWIAWEAGEDGGWSIAGPRMPRKNVRTLAARCDAPVAQSRPFWRDRRIVLHGASGVPLAACGCAVGSAEIAIRAAGFAKSAASTSQVPRGRASQRLRGVGGCTELQHGAELLAIM
jgi:hypothetical protein